MRIITSIKEMQQQAKNYKLQGKSIGYVPTMGYLHEGHMALMEKARKENDILVLSIFVNPLQFGAGEDFDAYPRDFERDREVAEGQRVDCLFYPSPDEMYSSASTVKVTVHGRTDVLCGRSRPGHFDGVATVLAKLFNIIMPDRAYFGLKDAQQVAVVEGLVIDLNIPVELVPVPTIREKDGLAKSSRNVYLTSSERNQAKELFRSLQLAKERIDNGERNPHEIISLIEDWLSTHTEAAIDYVSLYSYPELKPVKALSSKVIIALAVKFSKARLIDNLILEIDNRGNK
jgi:pantoate--beta-alanine ligase